MEILIRSVSTGRPEVIGRDSHGEEIVSAINKRPNRAAFFVLYDTGFSQDTQVDQRHHGPSHQQAVYAMPADNLDWYAAQLGVEPRDGGMLGENLTVLGVTEDDVRIGDVFTWGPEARMRVSKVRNSVQDASCSQRRWQTVRAHDRERTLRLVLRSDRVGSSLTRRLVGSR